MSEVGREETAGGGGIGKTAAQEDGGGDGLNPELGCEVARTLGIRVRD
jgi:hypothetical protein